MRQKREQTSADAQPAAGAEPATGQPGTSRHRPRLTILIKLLLAFVVPTMVLFTLFAVVAYEVARRDLEAELGTRLAAVAASAAQQIRGKYLIDLGPGQDGDRAYLNTRRKLEAVMQATAVARIYIFDQNFTSRADTLDNVDIGTKYFQAELDRHELGRVFDQGAAVSSVLFRGEDGKLYKAGYAPVRASENEDAIVLALGVEAPAAYFARLADLKRSLLIYGGVLAFVVLAISVLVAALITRPVRNLVDAAERIGRGDWSAAIFRTSRDEIGFLAETMDQMRRDLGARDQRLQLMLSGIAHEVRNPLGGIELFAGILRDELDPGDERRAHVQRIEKELAYLKAVVNDFLDYARRPALELGDVDLAELCADVIELVQADADAAQVPVHLDAEPTPCRVDAGQLRRALLNLVRNAVQASSNVEHAEVRVEVRPGNDAKSAIVSVSNQGDPIPDRVRAHMFEPFFTTREKGTGLGLAFVKETVIDHGGEVTVTSAKGHNTLRVTLG